ncbi:hypothetical protein VFPPC_16487 [Pochonia chlamydosporia 170]|uniref:Uncharacterized protein n=1 Tax=Pochonia chlamydosporia 170 TaxID=1380566 RepID=A0A179FEQ4_METCM|nr:hypothetical protein VFPPC_16487 [Pochonia chlamydosporia 170]OAQ63539.1 hypothetical protein VFPPC_16487 [Pochonia chlamydosporia 170]
MRKSRGFMTFPTAYVLIAIMPSPELSSWKVVAGSKLFAVKCPQPAMPILVGAGKERPTNLTVLWSLASESNCPGQSTRTNFRLVDPQTIIPDLTSNPGLGHSARYHKISPKANVLQYEAFTERPTDCICHLPRPASNGRTWEWLVMTIKSCFDLEAIRYIVPVKVHFSLASVYSSSSARFTALWHVHQISSPRAPRVQQGASHR